MGCGASTALSARREAEIKALPLTFEERQRFEEALAASAQVQAEAAARHLQERRQLQQQLSEALRDLQRLKVQVGESCGVPVPLPARAPTEDGQPAVVGQQAAGDRQSASSAVRQPVEPAAGSHETSEAHARLLQRVPDHVQLLQLPPVIQDLHRGMPPDIASAPMRLVLIEAVISWGAALKVYEDVVVSECLDVPYTDVPEKIWEVTVTLSWRWGAQKPAAPQAGFSPMQPSQSEELIGALRQLAAAGFVYVWIDWCCVPQYSAPSMVEVLRSKVFYARARTMLVLPTFHRLPAEGIIRPLLARTQQLLAMVDESASDAAAAATALGSMLSKGQMACREYFSRVWTLAERLARYGRDEPLSCWLGLENWLGMLLDSVLAAAGVAHACNGHRVDDPKATVALYVKALDALGTAGGSTAAEGTGAGGMEGAVGGIDGSTSSAVRSAQLVEALMPLLEAASATGSLLGEDVEGLDVLLSELMHMGTRVWRLARLGEAPSSSWLLGYLADMQAGVYQAWSEPDRVWALYSYFSWKKPDVMSLAALAEAVKDLVTVAGGGAQHLAVAGSKVGLGARRLAAIAGVLGLGEFEEAERARAKALGQELLSPAAAGDIEEAHQLLSSGAEPDAQDMNGETPLHKAASNGHTEVVKALLAAGAGADIADTEGSTPLYRAASNGHTEVVQLLLAAGASADIANKVNR